MLQSAYVAKLIIKLFFCVWETIFCLNIIYVYYPCILMPWIHIIDKLIIQGCSAATATTVLTLLARPRAQFTKYLKICPKNIVSSIASLL